MDREIGGVKIWQYLRMDLYRILALRTGVLEQPHTIRKSLSDRLLSLPRYLYNTARYNPFSVEGPVELVIFDHVRHKCVGGENIDIYTKGLIDDLERQGRSFVVLEQPYQRAHFKTISPHRKYLDALIVRGFIRHRLGSVSLSQDETAFVSVLKQAIRERFEVDLDLQTRFRSQIGRFRVNYALYTDLFRKLRPGQIYLVVSYGQGEMIKAARDLGIETIELQHGVFGRYHLGYSFPDRTTPLDYFPDQFHVWSEYWKRIPELPLPEARIVVRGFEHLEHYKREYAGLGKNRSQILVISQGSIGSRLAETIRDNLPALSGYRIVYKLHPGEYDRWRSYPALVEMVGRGEVRLAKDVDLYRLMAESQFQIGVYSTALFEGIEFGCETVLVELPGIAYMKDLLESGRAVTFEEFLSRASAAR